MGSPLTRNADVYPLIDRNRPFCLVKGESNKDVAERVGRTKQNVGSTVKRIWDLYQSVAVDFEGEKLRKVDVWLPERWP